MSHTLPIEATMAEILARLTEIQQQLNLNSTAKTIDAPMSIKEAAAFLGYSVSTMYSFTRNFDIPFSKKGRKILFNREELLEWVASYRKKTINEILKETGPNLFKKG